MKGQVKTVMRMRKKKNGDKIPVDYCKRKFVKKPNKSKAGFVVYTDYKTILVTPNAHKNDNV